MRTQTGISSRQDCRTCHTDKAGGVLGVKTRQMNRDLSFPSAVTDNQLRAWNHIGLFEPKLDEAAVAGFASWLPPTTSRGSIEDRARSYLDANCAHCHRPGGTVAYFDARYDTPLAAQNLIQGQVLIDKALTTRIPSPQTISGAQSFSCASTRWRRSKCRRWRTRCWTANRSLAAEVD